MKKIFFQLAPAFLQLPYLLVENLKNKGNSIEAIGIITGKSSFVKKGQNLFPNSKSFNDIEKALITANYDLKKVNRYREIFGDEVLNKIIIADRHVGSSYVNGGTQPNSIIEKKVLNNNLTPIIYVVELLDFLIKEFTRIRPDLVFSYAVASSLSVALAEVSNYMGIKFITLTHTRVEDKTIFEKDYNGLLAPISELYSKGNISISSDAKFYLESFLENPTLPNYEIFNLKNLKKNHSYLALLKNILKFFAGFVLKDNYLRSNFKDSSINKIKIILRIKFFNVSFSKINLTEKYIYFPLHVDPEASTMVLSPYHTDQLSIIESISKSIPFDSFLYVKEHIHMMGRRPNGFYKKIKSLPKVKLISPFEDNFSIIKSANVVITITGTTGWEAMILKTPVIFIGNSPFITLKKGFIHCQDLSKLTYSFSQIDKIDLCSKDEILKYLSVLFKNSFSLPSQLLWGELSLEELDKYKEEINIFSNEFIKQLD